MPSYTAPVKDMMFLYDKLRDNKNYNELEKYNEVNSDLVKDILSDGMKEVSTTAMGDAIISKLQ